MTSRIQTPTPPRNCNPCPQCSAPQGDPHTPGCPNTPNPY